MNDFSLPEQQITPNYKPAIKHNDLDIDLAKDDMLMKLYGNSRRLIDCIFESGTGSFNSSELNFFGMELSGLLTCHDHELRDFRKMLQQRFARSLNDAAEQMAISYLDAQAAEAANERWEE